MEGVNAATVLLQDPWISEQPRTGHQNTVGLSVVHNHICSFILSKSHTWSFPSLRILRKPHFFQQSNIIRLRHWAHLKPVIGIMILLGGTAILLIPCLDYSYLWRRKIIVSLAYMINASNRISGRQAAWEDQNASSALSTMMDAYRGMFAVLDPSRCDHSQWLSMDIIPLCCVG